MDIAICLLFEDSAFAKATTGKTGGRDGR